MTSIAVTRPVQCSWTKSSGLTPYAATKAARPATVTMSVLKAAGVRSAKMTIDAPFSLYNNRSPLRITAPSRIRPGSTAQHTTVHAYHAR